eukprot:367720-Pleurochrysis_carterae.AAC.2
MLVTSRNMRQRMWQCPEPGFLPERAATSFRRYVLRHLHDMTLMIVSLRLIYGLHTMVKSSSDHPLDNEGDYAACVKQILELPYDTDICSCARRDPGVLGPEFDAKRLDFPGEDIGLAIASSAQIALSAPALCLSPISLSAATLSTATSEAAPSSSCCSSAAAKAASRASSMLAPLPCISDMAAKTALQRSSVGLDISSSCGSSCKTPSSRATLCTAVSPALSVSSAPSAFILPLSETCASGRSMLTSREMAPSSRRVARHCGFWRAVVSSMRAACSASLVSGGSRLFTMLGRSPTDPTASFSALSRGALPFAESVVTSVDASADTFLDLSRVNGTMSDAPPRREISLQIDTSAFTAASIASRVAHRSATETAGTPRLPTRVCSPPSSRSCAALRFAAGPESSSTKARAADSAALASAPLPANAPSSSGISPSSAPASRAAFCACGPSRARLPMADAALTAAGLPAPRARACTRAGNACDLSIASAEPACFDMTASAPADGSASCGDTAAPSMRQSRGRAPSFTNARRGASAPERERMISSKARCRAAALLATPDAGPLLSPSKSCLGPRAATNCSSSLGWCI